MRSGHLCLHLNQPVGGDAVAYAAVRALVVRARKDCRDREHVEVGAVCGDRGQRVPLQVRVPLALRDVKLGEALAAAGDELGDPRRRRRIGVEPERGDRRQIFGDAEQLLRRHTNVPAVEPNVERLTHGDA